MSALAHAVGAPVPGRRKGYLVTSGFDTRGRIIRVVTNESGDVITVMND